MDSYHNFVNEQMKEKDQQIHELLKEIAQYKARINSNNIDIQVTAAQLAESLTYRIQQLNDIVKRLSTLHYRTILTDIVTNEPKNAQFHTVLRELRDIISSLDINRYILSKRHRQAVKRTQEYTIQWENELRELIWVEFEAGLRREIPIRVFID